MNAYQQLIHKLDGFIRKYYLNQIVKGSFLFLSWLLLSYLLVSTTEFYGQFDQKGRTALFILFILINIWILVRYLVIPYAKLNRLGHRISHEEAAQIIGKFFPNVSDKLLNTIQLHEESKALPHNELLLASIEQKTAFIRPLAFGQVIDLRQNKRYLRYLIPVVVVFVAVLFAAPSIITEAGQRVLRYNETFIPQAPFNFLLENDSLEVIQYADFTVQLKLTGSELPAEVFLETEKGRFKLEKVNPNEFKFVFREMQQNTKFRFSANKFYSIPYTLRVLPKPVINKFDVVLDYPAYVGKKDERLTNTGDLLVPEGTIVRWEFQVKSVDGIRLIYDIDSTATDGKMMGDRFSVQKTARKSSDYSITASNKTNPTAEVMQFKLNVVPDAFPDIQLEAARDSNDQKMLYFSGEIADDYGFSTLKFKAEITGEQGQNPRNFEQNLSLGAGIRQSFYHYFDLRGLQLKAGEQLSYYFEVGDNDQLSGSKKSRSTVYSYRQLTEKETQQEISKQSDAIVDKLKASLKEVQQLQQDADKLKRKLQDQKSQGWEDKKLLEQIQKREANIEEQLKEVRNELQKQGELKKELEPDAAELLKKQDELKEMVEKLLNDDLKKLMEELQKMMQQEKQPQLQEKLDELKMDNKDIAKELDRMLEFFKAMEVEQKAEQAVKALDKLADEQQKLALENEKKSTDNETAAKKQDALNEKFDALKEEMAELKEKNEELEEPLDLDGMEEENQEISEEMKSSSGDLQQKKQQQAAKKQKEAAKKMDELAKKMRMQMEAGKKEQLELDIRALRQLLENLVKYSFGQEALIDRLKDNTSYSQAYVEIGKDQFKLREDASLIEDSLLALSKRVIQIQSFVNKEIGDMNDHLQKTVDHLSNRQTPQARARQQYAMTSANNLAVMLSEILKQMQQEMSEMESKKSGSESQCMKPGKSGKSSMSKLSQLQRELNQQMQQMKEGQKPGEQGQKGQKGQRGNQSKEFSEAAARQEAIRRELQKLNEEYNKDGKKPLGDLDRLSKEMEKTEKELVNKMLSQQTLRRQEEIMTRLLESEKAERERDEEERRESKSATEIPKGVPPGFEAYRKQKNRAVDLYRTLTPELNAFYKDKVDAYFLQINR